MIIMALDHVRDFFHWSAYHFDPTDPTHTTLPIFFTRWITHFCAPIFSFLAGVSIFFIAKKKSKTQLSLFLLSRGAWLILMELTIINFAWFFDIHFQSLSLMVIASLGACMMLMSVFVYIPRSILGIVSAVILIGHHFLPYEGNTFMVMLHGSDVINLFGLNLWIGYPLLPWLGVMMLGFAISSFIQKNKADGAVRYDLFLIGVASILAFVILRWLNGYGDQTPFTSYPDRLMTFFSFMNPSKYPPSIDYLLMTLGPCMIFLAFASKIKGVVANVLAVYGRVPFFYYILHLYFIHLLAMIAAVGMGLDWTSFIADRWINNIDVLIAHFGFPLWVVYLVWMIVVAGLYPLCKKFDAYKRAHKEKAWLSYL